MNPTIYFGGELQAEVREVDMFCPIEEIILNSNGRYSGAGHERLPGRKFLSGLTFHPWS